MNYIWDVLINAVSQGIPKEAVDFVPAKSANPYRELGLKLINQKELLENPVEVNTQYRFSNIFDYFLGCETGLQPESIEILFNTLVHFLAETDLRQGLSKIELYKLALMKDIENGIYGKKYTKLLKPFSVRQKDRLLSCLYMTLTVGSSLELSTDLIKEMFQKAIVYWHMAGRRELFLYIGQTETPDMALLVDFVQDSFIPIDYIIHVFWDMHFGIIGVDETMEIEEIMLY